MPQVKVLDFGLAVADARQRLRAEVAGTLGYIAPEVLLGGPPSEASDLYSVGVIACEVLTGRDPFGAADDDQLLRRVIEREPSRERLDLLGALGPLGELGAFIARLLARAPEDRYASAAATLTALAAASGQALGTETAAVRESFLQAAPFIGRDSDWSAAQHHLEALMGAGTGGCLLIMGESGVGKSRFLDELRARALVRGAHVVRGQAVSSGGGAYHALRDALPPLCLSAKLSDADAGVLKALVPNLPALLERPIPDLPAVDAQAAQLRVLNSFEALLSAQPTPTVLLLEDLQWADAESLGMLRRGLAVAQTRPLLFVGTARIEERPQLAEELSITTLLRLQRLPPNDIAELCRSMLGTRPPESLVALVERETEGNVFFVVEVMRALAEEAGGLGQVGAGGLPDRVLTGGIRAVLQRRLDRVPEPARPLLCLAAVAGRQLDLPALRCIEPRLEEWLHDCADAAVLEVSEQRWRFSHDKLREGLLRELAPEERRALHRRVALALESQYAGDVGRAGELSYHFGEAGDDAAAARYGSVAGEQALAQGALAEAAALLQKVVERLDAIPDTPRLEQTRARRLYSQALFGLGRMQDCVETFEKALPLLDKRRAPDARKIERRLALIELVATHALHQVWPGRARPPRSPEEHALLAELLQITVTAGETYAYLGRSLDLLQCILSGIELGRAVKDAHRQALTTSVAAFLLSLTPLRALAPRYLTQAEALVRATSDLHAEAQFCRIGGLVYMFGAQWERGESLMSRSAELWRSLRDDLMLMFTMNQMAVMRTLIGDLDRAQQIFEDVGAVARRGRHPRFLIGHEARLGILAVRRGRHVEARARFLVLREQVRDTQDRVVKAAVLTGLTAACVRVGDFAAALQAAEELRAATPSGATGYNYAESVFEILNAVVGAAEHAARGARIQVGEERIESSLRLLRTYGRGLYIARPQALVIESRIAALRGQRSAALRYAQKGLELAVRLRMPYEQALAHDQLSRLLQRAPLRAPLGSPDGSGDLRRAAEHRTAARALYLRVGDVLRADAVEVR